MGSSSVSKMAAELIKPSEPTPSGVLPLSFMDRVPALKYLGPQLVVFGEGKEPAKVIREALAKTLVPYYPIAGRLTVADDGELSVDCTGEGVWFVEATYGCTLEDVNYVQEMPLMIPVEDLLPPLPADVDPNDISFMLQVTQFKCGGFTLGIRHNHAIVDGAGLGQFVAAFGEIARGLNEPTTKPVWHRDAINSSTPIVPKWPEPSDSSPIDFSAPQIKLRGHKFDISLDRIKELKLRFMAETGKTCTAFDILVAKLWQSRTRAIGLQPPNVDVSLHFSMNTRQALHDVLPSEGGYYGNCIHPLLIQAPVELIANAPLFDIVKLIKAEKESLFTKFRQWMKGLEPLPPMTLTYNTLCLMNWRWTGLYEVDFEWGTTKYVVPLMEHGLSFGSGCILNQPPPMKGIRLLTECVAEEHFEDFHNEMKVLC